MAWLSVHSKMELRFAATSKRKWSLAGHCLIWVSRHLKQRRDIQSNLSVGGNVGNEVD